MDKKFRGDLDLEIVIEQKENEIITLNNIIQQKNKTIDQLEKEIEKLKEEAKEMLLYPW